MSGKHRVYRYEAEVIEVYRRYAGGDECDIFKVRSGKRCTFTNSLSFPPSPSPLSPPSSIRIGDCDEDGHRGEIFYMHLSRR